MDKTRKAYKIYRSFKKYVITASVKRRPTYRAKLFAALEKLNKQYDMDWVPMQILMDQIRIDAEANSEKLGPRAKACIQREMSKAEANGFVETNGLSNSSRVTEETQDLFSFFRLRVEGDQCENQELALRDFLSQTFQGGPDKPWTKAEYESLLVFLHEHPEMDGGMPTTSFYAYPPAEDATSPARPAAAMPATPCRQLSSCNVVCAYPTPESAPRHHQPIYVDANTQHSPCPSRRNSFIDASGVSDDDDDDGMTEVDPETVPLAQTELQAEYDRLKRELDESLALKVEQADRILWLENEVEELRMEKEKADAQNGRREELEIEHGLCKDRISELMEERSRYRALIEFHANALIAGLQQQGSGST